MEKPAPDLLSHGAHVGLLATSFSRGADDKQRYAITPPSPPRSNLIDVFCLEIIQLPLIALTSSGKHELIPFASPRVRQVMSEVRATQSGRQPCSRAGSRPEH